MAEIKISELSIGDWVNQKMNDGAYQVQWLERETVGLIKHTGTEEDGSIRLTAVPLSFIEPIPLTPEILEKNGWLPPRKAIELDTWWWTNGVDKAIEAYEYKGEWHLTIIEQKEIQYRNRVGIGLKYVHQLQHALRLAGVEKEIEL